MMRKVVLYIAVSIDNYIARHDGDVSWLNSPDFALPGEDFGYQKMYSSIDAVLMGHNTYREILGFDVPYPYSDKTNYIISNSELQEKEDYIHTVSGNVVDHIRDLKMQKGKNIWLVGGGVINGLLLENGLIDEIILTVVPKTLGEGIPLFANNSSDFRFHLKESKSFPNGFVQLTYNQNVIE